MEKRRKSAVISSPDQYFDDARGEIGVLLASDKSCGAPVSRNWGTRKRRLSDYRTPLLPRKVFRLSPWCDRAWPFHGFTAGTCAHDPSTEGPKGWPRETTSTQPNYLGAGRSIGRAVLTAPWWIHGSNNGVFANKPEYDGPTFPTFNPPTCCPNPLIGRDRATSDPREEEWLGAKVRDGDLSGGRLRDFLGTDWVGGTFEYVSGMGAGGQASSVSYSSVSQSSDGGVCGTGSGPVSGGM
ncbi:hypothetical protein KM043_006692 [Ampulex compressa]|nr:hypothetical protein KM043_006692 [Ampulex compressa]